MLDYIYMLRNAGTLNFSLTDRINLGYVASVCVVLTRVLRVPHAAVIVRSSKDRRQTGVGENIGGGSLQRRLGQNGSAHLSGNANA